ncbi:unnamed protein product [Ectocarpus sp. CCAP 1310/34]|nr:unnamed protein product [Ectocarpus sp. CCAP 1310/34]
MPGVRKPASYVARNSFGGQQEADNNAVHSTIPIHGTNKKMGREPRRDTGGTRARPPLLVRILVRSVTDPRVVTLLVLTAVTSPALFFFGRDAHRPEGTRTSRLQTDPDPRRPATAVLFPRTLQQPSLLPLRSQQQPLTPGQQQQQPGSMPPPTEETVKDKPVEEWAKTADAVSPWKPAVLPLEEAKDAPPDRGEECLPSPLCEKRVDPSKFEFGCEEIESMLADEKKLIGHGNIRDVYLVEWGGRKLVVKALREDFELRASRRRADKIHRWEATALDEVRGHPNIVDMLGLCESSSVSEFFPSRLDDLVLKDGAKPLPIALVVSMALDAARGLQALHEAPGGAIVHSDINPQQLMLDEYGRIKINDLSMCRFPPADAEGNTCPYPARARKSG